MKNKEKGFSSFSEYKKRMDEIEEKAKNVLIEHNLYSIPVDPVILANKNGIKVNNALFSEENISGLVAKRGDLKSILIKQSDSPLRKRFTIAHELGHIFLHLENDGEYIDNSLDLYREFDVLNEDTTTLIEIESNNFAAALLMPKDLLIKAYKENKDLTYLAKLFNVSEQAMGIRVNKLGLI